MVDSAQTMDRHVNDEKWSEAAITIYEHCGTSDHCSRHRQSGRTQYWVVATGLDYANHSCSARAKRTLFLMKSARTLTHFIYANALYVFLVIRFLLSFHLIFRLTSRSLIHMNCIAFLSYNLSFNWQSHLHDSLVFWNWILSIPIHIHQWRLKLS